MKFRYRLIISIVTIIFLCRTNGMDLVKTVSEDLPALLQNDVLKNRQGILPGSSGLSDDAVKMRTFWQLIKHTCEIVHGLDQTNAGLQLTQAGLGDILKDPVKNLGGGVDKVGKGTQQLLGGTGQSLQGAGGIGADGLIGLAESLSKG